MISVVICSHNPREAYLGRALVAIREQTLPQDQWELLLIDNASKSPLADSFDLSWHGSARHIHEHKLGLTHARVRGMHEAGGSLILFVDDDNILAADFLEVCKSIDTSYPYLGAWGGSIDPEFESVPAEWTKAFWGSLAIRPLDHMIWSNDPKHWRSQPCGAGLCIRKSVAIRYLEQLENNPLALTLDRKGSALTSAGDIDIVFAAGSIGMGWGRFPELQVTHLMPEGRLSEDYLVRLREGSEQSSALLSLMRGEDFHLPSRLRAWMSLQRLRLSKGRRAARFAEASDRGRRAAAKIYREHVGVSES